jgi:hypothetical protein
MYTARSIFAIHDKVFRSTSQESFFGNCSYQITIVYVTLALQQQQKKKKMKEKKEKNNDYVKTEITKKKNFEKKEIIIKFFYCLI